jgi:hypothetical protein
MTKFKDDLERSLRVKPVEKGDLNMERYRRMESEKE